MQMHEAWFSAFREDFGPTSYGNGGHLAVNFRLLICFLVFLVPYLAFIVVFPGIREKRLATFVTLTLHLTVGALLTACLVLPFWSTGHAGILAHFQTHSRYRHEAKVGVYVGLQSINLTLKYIKTDGSEKRFYEGLDLNERYDLNGVSSMATELQAAYRDGKPYPILKMLEYFSVNQGAFEWGRRYRTGGHYTHALVWTALAIWMLQCVLLAFLPHYYSKAGVLCGIFLFLANTVYALLSPSDPAIPFAAAGGETTHLCMHFGVCFYLCIVAGLISVLFSGTLCALQCLRLYSLSTCLSSYLDECVGPSCRKVRMLEVRAEQGTSSAVSETSTYISDESVSHDAHPKHRRSHDRSQDPDGTNYRKRSMPSETNRQMGSSGFQSRSSLRSSIGSFSGSRDSIVFSRSMSNTTVDDLEPFPRRSSDRAVL